MSQETLEIFTAAIVSILLGVLFFLALSIVPVMCHAQDAPRATTVRAAGKTVECVRVTKTLTVCTQK